MTNVRGAHSAFMKDGYPHTDDKNGCARVMLLRQNGVEEKHDEATLARFSIGHGNEDYFCDTFLAGLQIRRDVALKRGRFEGHADVIVGDVVYELKSVTSKNVWNNVTKGKYKLGNLAQLVGYMWANSSTNGVLAYTFYVDGSATSTRQFAVMLTSKGKVVVDGLDSGYTLDDWLEHHKYMLDGLDSQWLHPDQPVNPKDNFTTPCTYCPWSSVCDSFNPFKATAIDFISACKKVRDGS